jgi:MFS family permease
MNVKNIQPVVPSSSSTFSQLRALFKGQVLALCLVILLNFIASGMLNPILPLYLTDLGASGVMVGLLMSVFGLGEGIFGFIWGSLADRIGITIPLSVQMAGLFLSLVGFALFPIIGMVFMLRFVMASLGSAIWPTGRGFLAYSVPLGSKGLAMAVFAVLVNGGMNIGSFVSGAIVATRPCS